MTLPADTVSLLLATWLWPFLRVAALLTSAPLLGATYVNRRVRLALAFALAGAHEADLAAAVRCSHPADDDVRPRRPGPWAGARCR